MKEAARNWLKLIEKSGLEGQTWVEIYRHSGVDEMIRLTKDALLLLRAGRLNEATAILSGICAGEDKLNASVFDIFRRHYQPVIAYYHYCAGDMKAAWESLGNAEQAIQAIVSTHPYLLAMAESCIDFTIQKARIARAMQDWGLMWTCLWKARDMAANRIPLCATDKGNTIYFSTIAEVLRTLDLTEEEFRAWREVIDNNVRQSIVERLIREVYTLPGFVIDY